MFSCYLLPGIYQYKVDTDSRPMIFTRRDRGKGKRSTHYSHVIEQAFVDTGLETKLDSREERVTRREGVAAEIGQELLSKFAHGLWKGVTDQLEKGIKNPRSKEQRNQKPEKGIKNLST